MQYAAKYSIIYKIDLNCIVYSMRKKILPVNKYTVQVIEHVSYYALQIGSLLKMAIIQELNMHLNEQGARKH